MTFEMVFAVVGLLVVLAMLLVGTLWSDRQSKREREESRRRGTADNGEGEQRTTAKVAGRRG